MIDFSRVKSMTIPEGNVQKILAGGVMIWQEDSGETPSYTNRVPLSINADGSIYNGKGYKDGYRIRSGGAEGEQSGATCTGFIPVHGGDVIRIAGCSFSTANAANAVNVSDSSFANLGQFTSQPSLYGIFSAGAKYEAYNYSSVVEESTGIWKWVVPPAESGVAFIRVTGYNASGVSPGAALIVTVNEEIA